ncbi:hypothetical protein SAMN03097699_0654 [Flavobacteriaceae bacterium MAR_2010_188]|nr:hypothetical protein SAMN03097699_0654 [Flavobacteriaceae bacterium MAR_2010_188]
MKLKLIFKELFILIALIGISSCKQDAKKKTDSIEKTRSIGIYNFDNKQELIEYNKMNLGESHPNLLNPQISKTDYDSVMESWTDLHQQIGNYLSENKFTWEVEDETITIVHKIYFEPNGEIENYFFNVLNQTVTKEKKEQFADLISDFAETNRIDFKRDKSFAQCGKTKYLNE